MNVIDRFFQSNLNLPMLPKVVQDVLQMLNREDVDLNALARVVDHDQVISAKVLRLANSSYYGASRNVKTLDDAIAIVGFNNFRTLVIASGITGSITHVPGMDLRRFWRHALVTAGIARTLSRELHLEADTAYISALMHSIGQLLIHLVFPAAGADIEETCQGRCVLERKAVEHTVLGFDHCQVGAELAERWNFPEEIQRVIRYYADPLNPKACKLAPVVYVAAHIAFGLELGEDARHIAETLNPDVAAKVGMDRIEWIDRIESCRSLLAEADSFI